MIAPTIQGEALKRARRLNSLLRSTARGEGGADTKEVLALVSGLLARLEIMAKGPGGEVFVGILKDRRTGISVAAFAEKAGAEAWCRERARVHREHWGYEEGECWDEYTERNNGLFAASFSGEGDTVTVGRFVIDAELGK